MSASVINRYVGAIDQGTSSTKFVVYDHQGHPVGTHQLEHKQLIPEPGLVEHNPIEIWVRVSLPSVRYLSHHTHSLQRTSTLLPAHVGRR